MFFLLHYSLANSMTNWVKIFTGLFFYAYVRIHQVIWEYWSSHLVYPNILYKLTNLRKYKFNSSSQLQENNGRKTNTLVAQIVCFQMPWIRAQLRSRIQFNYFGEKSLLSKNLLYSRGRFHETVRNCASPLAQRLSRKLRHKRCANGLYAVA